MAAQPHIGLDLGFSSIKAVALSGSAGHLTLVSVGSIATPPRGILSETPADEQNMVNIIARLFHDMNVTVKNVNIALPESQVFSRVIEIPKLTEKELSSAIQWEAEQYIPLPINQVNVDYAILESIKESDTMKVILVAAPIRLIEKYTRILETAGLTIGSIETDAIALSRIIPKNIPADANLLLLSIGASSSDICIMRKNTLSFVRSIPTGGESLTRVIAEEMGFTHDQAEEYKKTYGLDTNQLEGKIAASIQPVFTTIIEEINKVLAFYKEHYPNDSITGNIISGGSAKLPGLIGYITSATGVDSQIATPFEGIAMDEKSKSLVESSASTFTIATGLAMKDLIA